MDTSVVEEFVVPTDEAELFALCDDIEKRWEPTATRIVAAFCSETPVGVWDYCDAELAAMICGPAVFLGKKGRVHALKYFIQGSPQCFKGANLDITTEDGQRKVNRLYAFADPAYNKVLRAYAVPWVMRAVGTGYTSFDHHPKLMDKIRATKAMCDLTEKKAKKYLDKLVVKKPTNALANILYETFVKALVLESTDTKDDDLMKVLEDIPVDTVELYQNLEGDRYLDIPMHGYGDMQNVYFPGEAWDDVSQGRGVDLEFLESEMTIAKSGIIKFETVNGKLNFETGKPEKWSEEELKRCVDRVSDGLIAQEGMQAILRKLAGTTNRLVLTKVTPQTDFGAVLTSYWVRR